MKNKIIKIIISGLLFIIAIVCDFNNDIINKLLYIIAYIIIGYDVIKEALENIFKGELFDENFLMTIATIGAFIIDEYPEAVSVMLFYQIGELLQEYATEKTKKSITSLMDIHPDYANLLKNNEIIKVNPEEVAIDDLIVVKPGEKVPLDGIVIEGNTTLNMVALTGEALPKSIKKNDRVLSGSININGVIKVKVTEIYQESTVKKILDLVENTRDKKSTSENFITKFAAIYTPIVVLIAVFLAILMPILTHGDFKIWLYRSLSFLVVSCPCALVISVPLSFFATLGWASKNGILIKGSNYLEKINKIDTLIFDKTGTLTEGKLSVQKIKPVDISKNELLKIVATAEYYSKHPIGLAIKNEYDKKIDEKIIKNYKELSGMGIICEIDNHKILVGNNKLMSKFNVNIIESEESGTIIYGAVDGKFCGYLVVNDKIKNNVKKTIECLKQNNKKIVMLTGDIDRVGKNIGKKLNVDDVYTELLPQDKVDFIKSIKQYEKVIFIGDGINDAPALCLADVGISMGGVGSDSAIEASDIVIMNDDISKIIDLYKLSHQTMKIVYENIIFAIGIKILVLLLTAFGLSSMWQAVFADVGVTFITVLNSLRLFLSKF